MKLLTQICFFLIMTPSIMWADQEPFRSNDEMRQRSQIVMEGRVDDIKEIGTEEIPVAGEAPVVIKQYAADVTVINIVKGALSQNQTKKKKVVVRFQKINDNRYRGEKGPDIKIGSRYLFYFEAVRSNESGEPTPYVHGNNNVRLLDGQ
jgi:hypothetical protein